MERDTDGVTKTTKKYYDRGCWPKVDASTVFLTQAQIGLIGELVSVKQGGHIVDCNNGRLYVLYKNNALAVIGMTDGNPYAIAKLTASEVQSLGINKNEGTGSL